MAEELELWKRQAWDTNTSFDRFRQFYLFQEKPRSVNEAYRQYRRAQTGNEQVTVKQAPGSWRYWSSGKTARGEPIPGAQTWDARAKAYDDYLADLDCQKWEQRRAALREADWTTGEKLRQQANAALDQVPQFLRTTRRVVKGGKGQPDREVITLGLRLNEVSGAAKIASDLQRAAAEAPTVMRHELSGPGGGPIPYEPIGGLHPEQYARALEALADALREVVSRTGAAGPGAVGSAEPPAVAGVSESSG